MGRIVEYNGLEVLKKRLLVRGVFGVIREQCYNNRGKGPADIIVECFWIGFAIECGKTDSGTWVIEVPEEGAVV